MAVTRQIDLHGWTVDWDPRGLRLTHSRHTLVLGIPPFFVEYLDADPSDG